MIQKQGSWLPDINERVFPIVQPLIMKNTPTNITRGHVSTSTAKWTIRKKKLMLYISWDQLGVFELFAETE